MTKASKAGRQAVVIRSGKLVAARRDAIDPADGLLVPVWRNGELLMRAISKRSVQERRPDQHRLRQILRHLHQTTIEPSKAFSRVSGV